MMSVRGRAVLSAGIPRARVGRTGVAVETVVCILQWSPPREGALRRSSTASDGNYWLDGELALIEDRL